MIIPIECDTSSTNRNVYFIEACPTIVNGPTQPPLSITSNTSNKSKHEKELSIEERKKIHNRRCTLKQRKRYYHHKITRKNIDKRFTIKQIKNVLKQHDIPITAVNVLRLPFTNEKNISYRIKRHRQMFNI
ncbi:unnamed protein product [Rotaria sp. Silwood2]|nr:unnamed protein product [Rotaria sp. Silwood2]CAF4318428.1 unnamed protein product [Rotaria sp. Silwood2]